MRFYLKEMSQHSNICPNLSNVKKIDLLPFHQFTLNSTMPTTSDVWKHFMKSSDKHTTQKMKIFQNLFTHICT